MKSTLPVLCIPLIALALAACGGGDDDGGASQALEIFFRSGQSPVGTSSAPR